MSLKMTMFDTFKSLLRSAARALWHNPRITLSIWAVFSLGIGAVSAVFSVVEKVLLEPLPFPDPDWLQFRNTWHGTRIRASLNRSLPMMLTFPI